MTLDQFKTELVEDLKFQLFRKPRHHNWTSEAWYLHSPFYHCSRSVRIKAIEQLIANGYISRDWFRYKNSEPFTVLKLLPRD